MRQYLNRKATWLLGLALILIVSVAACAAIKIEPRNPTVQQVETIHVQVDNQDIHEYTVCIPDYLGWGLPATDTDLSGNLVVTYPTTSVSVGTTIVPSGYRVRQFDRPNLMSSKDYIKIEKCE